MKKIATLYFFIFLFFPLGIKAQNIQNYLTTAGSNESLVDGGGWTQLIGSDQINVASAITNIGFEVWFMGERFTTFSANTGGVMRFGSVQIVGEANAPAIAGNARVCVFGAAIETTSDRWRTENNGQVRYKVIGTSPNRRLIIDWVNIRMEGSATSNTGISRFQAHISETAPPPANTIGGVIKIVYGRMFIQSHSPTNGCSGGDQTTTYTGIGYGTSTTQAMYINTDNHPTLTGTNINYGSNGTNGYPSCNEVGAAPVSITSLNSTTNGSRKYYNFNPPAVIGEEIDASASCATTTSFILDWTDNATNEVGIVLYRSTDGVNYTFDRQLPANTTSASITGLTPNTTYHYQIYAVTEGKLSQLATTGTVIITTLPVGANVWYADASSNWNLATTWINNSVPSATSDVIISCKVPRTVTVATTAANECRTLTVLANNVLNINTGQTLRVRGDVNNSGTINLNGGTLIIEGNLTNTSTGIINAGTGFLRVAGNYTNAGVFNSQYSTIQFDGTTQQLINHTGTSSGQRIESTTTTSYNNNAALITPGTTTTYNNTTDINIPNNNTTGITRTITVPTTTATITDITVGLQINHNNVGDLFITITSPSGTTVTLINRMNSGLGTCTRNDIDATLSDAAGNDVQTRCIAGNINGTHRPAQLLSAFDGENPSGTWTLSVSDRSNLHTGVGTFRNWDLNISTTPTAGLIIPDNSVAGINHTINVPTSAIIQSVTMNLAIDHTYIGDLIVTLTSPAGTTRTMMTRVANGGGLCGGDNLSITFDDLAITDVQSQCGGGTPSISGTFQPNQTLTVFSGQNQQGNWIINVADRANADIGRIMSATLTINNQQITTFPISSNLYFHNMIVLNTGTGVRTQNTDIHITNNSTWTDGIFTADNNHKFIFVDNSTSTVATNASHADMQVRKIGNDAFNFPVGNAGWAAPIGISAPANTTHHFTAQYFRQVTPYDPFSKEASIHHVGQCEYWILDRTNGASNVVVTLSYDDIRSCTVGPTTGLKVVRWDGSIWRDHFNGGIINTPYNGVLSAGTVNNFSPFTLGALTDLNILPLTFLSFDAKPFESDAILDWTTTGELNHDYFEIERSINGEDFKYIGKIKNPITRDNTKSTYSFTDENIGIENREAYYRLRQIDTDGKFAYSDIKKINWDINFKNQSTLIAYPNPFTDILTLEFDIENQENIEIILMDMAGRTIKTFSTSLQKGRHKVEFDNLQKLAQGNYLVQLKGNNTVKTFKVVKI